MEDILIPIAALALPVAIVWITAHYKYKNRALGHMTEDQMAELERMSRTADILDQRVNVLENILDDEIPEWREKHDKTI